MPFLLYCKKGMVILLQLHNAKHFRFDGKLDKRWFIVNTTNETSFSLARKKSLQIETGIFQPVFKGITSELPSFDFEIFKVNDNLEPVEMTTQDLFELNKWLDRSEPKPLEVNGFIYYGIFSPQNGMWYPNKLGRIELKFDMAVPYMYGAVVENNYRVKKSKIINIENKSNIDELVYPDIEIMVINGDSVTIKNLTNGKETTLNNLKVDNIYRIYNQERQMVNLTNVKENVYFNSNRKYINLVYGINRFSITTNGEVKVKFTYQPKVCLQ